jgi:hypothetical protein
MLTATRRPLELARAHARGLTAWDVASGRVDAIPLERADRLWAQVPAIAGPVDGGRRRFPLFLPDGELWLPAEARELTRGLATMPSCASTAIRGAGASLLLAHGVFANQDLPLRIIPDDVPGLDGWRFA